MRKLGILTSGGDAPGMNAALRAAVRSATAHGLSMVGYRDGYTGFVERRFIDLDDRVVGNQIHRGGTFIGTSRCPAFREAEVRARAVAQAREDGVDGLVVVGGDGSFRGALALQAETGFPVVGVPGTIDNDIWGTEETIGFDTAVNTAVQAIDQLRDTAESTGTMFFVEVMGRSSGALAISTAVAGGAAGIFVPEQQGEHSQLVERLRRSIARGKRCHIVVVAEGEEEGGAFAVAEKVGKQLEHPYRVAVLGHVQRGGRPSARDRIIAAQMGAAAVQALVAGPAGVMIGVQNGQPVEVPLAEVCAHGRQEPRMDLLRLAVNVSA